MRRPIVSAIASCAILATAAAAPLAVQAAATDPVGVYGWVAPSAASDSGDLQAGVRFPFNATSGYAGVVYPVLGVDLTKDGDGRQWQPAQSRTTVANAVPAFCIQEGAVIEYDVWYTRPGSAMTVTVGGFTPGASVSGSGSNLTVTAGVADADGFAELQVKLASSVAIGTSITLTATAGATTTTETIIAADPFQVKDWSVSRAAAPQNMGIAAWIAAHADTYSLTGVKGGTYNSEADPVASTVLTTTNPQNESVEAAAAQLAIWQALAGKNIVAGTPAASSPIANYTSAGPHRLTNQELGDGGAFPATPDATAVDTWVVNRAKELFIAATGDGIIGGSDDRAASEPARSQHVAVTTGTAVNGLVPVTVTATRQTAAGVTEALPGVTVTLTGADFDSTTAGVQSATLALGATGVSTTQAVVTPQAQTVTAVTTLAAPAGSLLAVADDNGPASAPGLQLQQLITARAATFSVAATGVVPGTVTTSTTVNPGATTTVPTTSTTLPSSLPYSGPGAPLAIILSTIAAGGLAVLVRRRLAA